jgi:hypothetical protein
LKFSQRSRHDGHPWAYRATARRFCTSGGHTYGHPGAQPSSPRIHNSEADKRSRHAMRPAGSRPISPSCRSWSAPRSNETQEPTAPSVDWDCRTLPGGDPLSSPVHPFGRFSQRTHSRASALTVRRGLFSLLARACAAVFYCRPQRAGASLMTTLDSIWPA